MISYLRGPLAALTPTTATIECGGVGYDVFISLTTYSLLARERGEVKLYTSPVIREDAHLLYGFATTRERELFLLLTSVSSIGPNTARVILSQYAPEELEAILSLGQVDALKAVKGIGLKTAQRIVLELQGKVSFTGEATTGLSTSAQSHIAAGGVVAEEATSALKMLGYPEAAVQKVVRQILASSPRLEVAEVIKIALKSM